MFEVWKKAMQFESVSADKATPVLDVAEIRFSRSA